MEFVLSVVSLYYQQMLNFLPRADLLIEKPNDISKGVTTLERCSILLSYLDNDVPFFLCQFFGSLKTDFAISFIGIKAVHFCLAPPVQDVPNEQPPVMNFTILHNKIWDFASLFERCYADPYLVDVHGKILSGFIPTDTYCVVSYVGPDLGN